MTSIQKLAVIVLGSFSMSCFAADFSTPENAIKSLEAAYIKKDIEAAVAAKDFWVEAQLMLRDIKPQYANDAELIKQTAEVLELAFRKEMKDNGFPDFQNLNCSLGKAQSISRTLVKITETCIFPDGGKSVEDLHVFNGKKGWRVVNVPEKS